MQEKKCQINMPQAILQRCLSTDHERMNCRKAIALNDIADLSFSCSIHLPLLGLLQTIFSSLWLQQMEAIALGYSDIAPTSFMGKHTKLYPYPCSHTNPKSLHQHAILFTLRNSDYIIRSGCFPRL